MNKLVKFVLVSVVLFVPHQFCAAQGRSLEVTISKIKSAKGSIRVGLFTEKDFLKTPVDGRIVKAAEGSVTVVFDNLAEGDYAVSVIHDENENGELDTNKLGIPKEGFAFGNNASGKLGPPTYEKAKVEIRGEPVKQALVMKYI